MKALSGWVSELSFWNFSTIERSTAFSWLKTIFQAKPVSLQFYINVSAYTVIFTAISLFPYLIVPFSDPLNVSLVGYPRFLLMGFFIPNIIVALISMTITVALLTLGSRIKNGLIYILILALDGLIVSTLIATLSINLELTRTYLLALYNGEIATDRWRAFYQPLLAMQYVIGHPDVIMESFKSEVYTSSKYTTYILSIAAMLCAVFPLLIHAVAAVFLVAMYTFHNFMKKLASFLLRRMNEQKTFKWLTWAFGLPVIIIKIWDSL